MQNKRIDEPCPLVLQDVKVTESRIAESIAVKLNLDRSVYVCLVTHSAIQPFRHINISGYKQACVLCRLD